MAGNTSETDRRQAESSAGTTAAPTQAAAPAVTLPKGGGAIRGIGEKFSVGAATGTGSLSVPIFTSSGRNGFHPDLSLEYDSGSGNGPFGFGWQLSIPSITRKTERGLPRYRDLIEGDVFVLSGATDLVPVLDGTGTRVSRISGGHRVEPYRPRVESSYARIERLTDPTTGDAYWRATTRDNITSTYGRTPQTRLADPDDPRRVFRWLLEETSDGIGNLIRYQYKPEDRQSVPPERPSEQNRRPANLYLKRIFYGNERPDDDSAFHFQVVFDYGEHTTDSESEVASWPLRPDPFSSYRAGFEIRTCRRCQRVLMFHRFPSLGGGNWTLVRDSSFHYFGDAVASFLSAATQTGYNQVNAQTPSLSLPPLSFAYSPVALDPQVHQLDPPSYEQLSGGVDGRHVRLLDLEGEGLPGVLIESAASWFYKRNLGEGRFDHMVTVATRPAGARLADGEQELTDLAGDGLKYLVQYRAPLPGYSERAPDGSWDRFTPFRSLPVIDWEDANLRFLDCDGDGLPELLLAEDQGFRWYPSLGREGFGPSERVGKAGDERQGPTLVFADETQSIFLADMSGDGLSDLVRIRNGDVCYWPSLGYGRFGPRVTMDRAPVFDSPTLFHASRIRTGDVDGSGTTDLFYIGHDGKVRFWLNQSGNGFGAEQVVTRLPLMDDVSTVSVTDLLGKGTACLVWGSPLPSAARAPLRYVDLMAQGKPHLLTGISNGLGMETRIEYAPSTRFYLEDRRRGRPWVTKLPFPVQVVAKVTVIEHVTGTTLVTSYHYSHGHYDGIEHEFGGFGLHEREEGETYAAYQVTAANTGTPVIAADLHCPPVLTRTWYHTGAWREEGPITRAYARDYYHGDPQAEPVLEPDLPPGLTAAEEREAALALRGHVVHEEVFQADQADHPYLVTEHSYTLERLQPMGGRHAVFAVHPRETVTSQYEQNPADPRIRQELALVVDVYGNVIQSASIAYPRRVPQLNAQDRTLATLSERDVRNDDQEIDWYRLGVEYESRSYELTGLPDLGRRYTVTDLLGFVAGTSAVPFETAPSGAPQRRLLKRSQQLFWDDALQNPLPLGSVGQRALPYETSRMAFTPGQLAFYGGQVSVQILTDAKYRQDLQGNWWAPSGVQHFRADLFYQPDRFEDPFGNLTIIDYDHALIISRVTDPLGHSTVVTNDFRLVLPSTIQDPNGNHSSVLFDPVGRVVATVIMGKDLEPVGDTPGDPTTVIDYQLNQVPVFAHVAAREEHHFVNAQPRWQHSYTYSDGLGREVLKKVQAEPGDAHFVDQNGVLQTRAADPRWVGTGRRVFDNRGHDVKAYEPYFSTTSDYENEQALVQWGVTPILRYDPLGRLIRTDHPNGTFEQVEFDAWQQVTSDANDTVLQSAWYTDNQNKADHDGDAARAAAKHAGTPTITRLDPLARVFLTIADNAAQKFVTTVELDIEGKQRSVTDARGVKVLTQDVDMLGRTLHTVSPDAGEAWAFSDVLDHSCRGWDAMGRTMERTYDVLQRPTHLWVTEQGARTLAERTVYGDQHPTGATLNAIGRVFRQFDQAGLVTIDAYDFKGNTLSRSRQVTLGNGSAPDWAAADQLPDSSVIPPAAAQLLAVETFTTATTVDALNRPLRITTPDGSVTTPTYNAAALLETLNVGLQGGAPTEFIANIDYNEKGQRVLLAYGKATRTTTSYEYDPLTFRLSRLATVRTSDNAQLQDLNYTYDPVGNITFLEDLAQATVFFSNLQVDARAEYEYDATYRLVHATGREHLGQAAFDQTFAPAGGRLLDPNDAAAMRRYREDYRYDEVGNFKEMKHGPDVGSGPTWTRTYTYLPASNRLDTTSLGTGVSTYGHDPNGNTTVMPHLQALDWNAKNQLRRVDLLDGRTVRYAYDASGERVRKLILRGNAVLEERIYLGGYEVYRKYSGTGTPLERQTLHVMDDKTRLALVETRTKGQDPSPPQLVRYQLANHLGSAVLELDRGGAVISYEEYHPYGTTAHHATTGSVQVPPKRYRFTTKERDEETGLGYHFQRYYAPTFGRWVSCDASGLGDGTNLFMYARCTPTQRVDPSGKASRWWVELFFRLFLAAHNQKPPEKLKPAPSPEGREKTGGEPPPPPPPPKEGAGADAPESAEGSPRGPKIQPRFESPESDVKPSQTYPRTPRGGRVRGFPTRGDRGFTTTQTLGIQFLVTFLGPKFYRFWTAGLGIDLEEREKHSDVFHMTRDQYEQLRRERLDREVTSAQKEGEVANELLAKEEGISLPELKRRQAARAAQEPPYKQFLPPDEVADRLRREAHNKIREESERAP